MDIQQLITLVLVVVAGAFLGRHLWRSVRADEDVCSGCGGCGKPSKRPEGVRSAPQPTTLVSLSTTPPRRKTLPRSPTSSVR